MLAQFLPSDLLSNVFVILGSAAVFSFLTGCLFIVSCELFNVVFKKRVSPLRVPKPELLPAMGLCATMLGLNALIWLILGAVLTQKRTLAEIQSHMTLPVYGIAGLISLTIDVFLISLALPTTLARGLALFFILQGLVLTFGLFVQSILRMAS